MTAAEQVTEAQRALLSEEALHSTVRWYHPGSESELQMFEVAFVANLTAEPHAHVEDEIIYVLEGQMIFGSRVLNPGGSVFIPGNTLYSFRAGPEGLRFLNFRAHQDLAFITKEQFMARRDAAKSST